MINVKITNFSGSLEVCGLTDIETCCLQLLSGEKTCIIADYRTLTRSPKPTKQVGGEGRLRKQSPVRVAGPGAPAGSGSPRRRCPVRRRARVSLSPDTSSCPVVVTASRDSSPRRGAERPEPARTRERSGWPRHAGRGHRPPPGPACACGPGLTRGPLSLTYSAPELAPAAAAAAPGGTSHDPFASSAPFLRQRRWPRPGPARRLLPPPPPAIFEGKSGCVTSSLVGRGARFAWPGRQGVGVRLSVITKSDEMVWFWFGFKFLLKRSGKK